MEYEVTTHKKSELMRGLVLPGSLMPWMWRIPRRWIPDGLKEIARYHLSECFSTEPRDEKGRNFWDVARDIIAERREPPLPPGSPDFWDRQGPYARYQANGGTLEYATWQEGGRAPYDLQ